MSLILLIIIVIIFCFDLTAPPVIHTLSLHDALPIYVGNLVADVASQGRAPLGAGVDQIVFKAPDGVRSEEHTSELQSLAYLVCRLLRVKKKRCKVSDEFELVQRQTQNQW